MGATAGAVREGTGLGGRSTPLCLDSHPPRIIFQENTHAGTDDGPAFAGQVDCGVCRPGQPECQIVSFTSDNPRHRYTYKDAFARARQLANVLAGWGLSEGDRIATLAWNDYRHFEAYYGISCSGFVSHTINPRLFPEQVAWIINHA